MTKFCADNKAAYCRMRRVHMRWPKTNSHRHARHDKTVLSVSRPLRRCELDSRQLKTVADRNLKSEHANSNRSVHTATPDTTQTGLFFSCLVWLCELSRLDCQTGAFCVGSVGKCQAAQCDCRTHSDAERTCRTVLSCLAGDVNWA